jgi:hypothetical protein
MVLLPVERGRADDADHTEAALLSWVPRSIGGDYTAFSQGASAFFIGRIGFARRARPMRDTGRSADAASDASAGRLSAHADGARLALVQAFGTPMTLSRLALAAACALIGALVSRPSLAQALPIFDAHLHYNDEAREPFPVPSVLALFRERPPASCRSSAPNATTPTARRGFATRRSTR